MSPLATHPLLKLDLRIMDSRIPPTFPIIRPPMSLAATATSLAGSTSRAALTSTDKLVLQPRHWLYHEDVFSRILSGPFVIIHYAMYCFVPVVYLVKYSPFTNFEPGTSNQIIRWALLFLTQCFTAVLAVACFGKHYKVRKELIAFVFMGSAVFLVAGLKHVVEYMAASQQ